MWSTAGKQGSFSRVQVRNAGASFSVIVPHAEKVYEFAGCQFIGTEDEMEAHMDDPHIQQLVKYFMRTNADTAREHALLSKDLTQALATSQGMLEVACLLSG